MFQLSCSLYSSLLTILSCIYCSCFNALIRFNRHCLLFYSLYIVNVSTLLCALIVTAYYFILYILLIFQLSYSPYSSLLTILFCMYCSCFNSHIRFNRHYLLFILNVLFMFQLSYSF